MLNVFTSSKRLIVQSQTEKNILLWKFREQIEHDNLWSRLLNSFSLVGEYVGKTNGADIEVRRIWMVSNPLEPTMHIHIETAPNGGSILRTEYTTRLLWKVYYSIGLAVFCFPALIEFAKAGAGVSALVLFLPLAVILLVGLMRAIAFLDQRKLEQLVLSVANPDNERRS